MSYELKSAQDSSQKQDVTIQSLKESLKSKQSEVKCYMITDPWEIVHLVVEVSSVRLSSLIMGNGPLRYLE